ncbi:MAG: hypothetical protein ACTHLW_07585 [Verrucomicrobiota bacterium]
MNTWKVIFATLVIFVTGAVTGAMLVRFIGQEPPHLVQKVSETFHPAQQSTNAIRESKLPAPMVGPLRKDFIDRLQRELKIDADQRQRIEKIIIEGQEQTKMLWDEISPEMHRAIVETKDRIRAELTPAQQVKFAELFKSKSRNQPKANGAERKNAPPNSAPVVVTNSTGTP